MYSGEYFGGWGEITLFDKLQKAEPKVEESVPDKRTIQLVEFLKSGKTGEIRSDLADIGA